MQKKLLFFPSIFVLTFLLLISTKPIYALNSPQKISTSSNDNLAPAIVSDSNGKVHAVWMDTPDGWSSSTTSLLHSFWNGNVWTAPTTIFSGNFHELPSLAADNSGNVHLTWDSDTNPNAWQIYYSKYNGTSWSAATAISGATVGDVAWDSEITIDSSGNPHVAYTNIPAGTVGNQRFTYYNRFNGTSWVTPVDITVSGTFHQYPTIWADSTGKVHVAWKSDLLGSFEILSRFWNGSTFSTISSVSGVVAAAQEPQPRITVDNANNAHVVWEEMDPATSSNFLIKYSKYNGTSWAAPFTVSSVASQTVEGIPSVAVLRSSVDDVLVGWIDKTTSPLQVGFRKFKASTSSWELARSNTIANAAADFPVAAMDKWDNIHAAWGEINSTTGKYETFYDAIPLAVKIIGSVGGTLTTFNNDTLTIPSGSLSQDTIISAQIAPLSQTAPSGNITPPRQYIFEPTGTVFNPALTAVFKYTDAEISGGNENTLGIYVWDSGTNSWVFKTGSINKPQNKLTVQLNHFSIYGLFESTDVIYWIPPLKVDGKNEFPRGETIPIKFKSNNPSDDPKLMRIQLLEGETGRLVKEFNSLPYNSKNEIYHFNLNTDNLATGEYQITVLYKSLPKDSIHFVLK